MNYLYFEKIYKIDPPFDKKSAFIFKGSIMYSFVKTLAMGFF